MRTYFRLLLLICFLFFIFEVWVFGETIVPADSTVEVSGFVYDSLSGNPVDSATVVYQDLPYGNSVGIIRTKPETGYFEFNTMGTEDYLIEVKAHGYRTITEKISPLSESVDDKIVRKYYLSRAPEEGDVIKLNHLIFAQGKSDITSESYDELDNLVKMMNDNPGMIIQLEGHTDFRGSASKNMTLSQERVEAVKTYLMQKGIRKDRILTKAFGGTHPISREATEEAARLNRRVVVRIMKK